jgi:large subunit ribosomal protein L19
VSTWFQPWQDSFKLLQSKQRQILNSVKFDKMLKGLRGSIRLFSTVPSSTPVTSYPFSRVAIIPPGPSVPPPKPLLKGTGLMPYLQNTLPTPDKQELLSTLFKRRHPKRLYVGSVLTVTLAHAPTVFSGVLISIRRRGPDTSFLLRNIIQGVGVEMQFFVCSPHLKEIKVVHRAGGSGPRSGKRMRRAKLFYLRDSPEKMTAISAGMKG